MKVKPADEAWVGLAVYVIVVDLFLIRKERSDKEKYYTMSTAFEKALEHPVKRWPIIILWVGLTVHLFDFFLPKRLRKYEPIAIIGSKIANLS